MSDLLPIRAVWVDGEDGGSRLFGVEEDAVGDAPVLPRGRRLSRDKPQGKPNPKTPQPPRESTLHQGFLLPVHSLKEGPGTRKVYGSCSPTPFASPSRPRGR